MRPASRVSRPPPAASCTPRATTGPSMRSTSPAARRPGVRRRCGRRVRPRARPRRWRSRTARSTRGPRPAGWSCTGCRAKPRRPLNRLPPTSSRSPRPSGTWSSSTRRTIRSTTYWGTCAGTGPIRTRRRPNMCTRDPAWAWGATAPSAEGPSGSREGSTSESRRTSFRWRRTASWHTRRPWTAARWTASTRTSDARASHAGTTRATRSTTRARSRTTRGWGRSSSSPTARSRRMGSRAGARTRIWPRPVWAGSSATSRSTRPTTPSGRGGGATACGWPCSSTRAAAPSSCRPATRGRTGPARSARRRPGSSRRQWTGSTRRGCPGASTRAPSCGATAMCGRSARRSPSVCTGRRRRTSGRPGT